MRRALNCFIPQLLVLAPEKNTEHIIELLWDKYSNIIQTNVTPIIRTHNILTSHNRTYNNPLEPIKKELYYYGFVYQQVTSENYYGNFVG
jgi:hypothetical protein